jgi:nitroreductase/FMN reductase [NAD(P)H]
VRRTIADLIEERFGLPTEAGRGLPADGALALLLSHRTQRRYAPDPVPDEFLDVALAAALSAPSKSDLQQVGIILVKDRARQATIAGWIPEMEWIAQAPRFLVICGDNRRLRRVSELRGRPFPNDTLDMFMNAAVDAGLVRQAFITAAPAKITDGDHRERAPPPLSRAFLVVRDPGTASQARCGHDQSHPL